jgi:hypothetical protein
MLTTFIFPPPAMPAEVMVWLREKGREFLNIHPNELTRKQLRVLRAAKEVGLKVSSDILSLKGVERTLDSGPSVTLSDEVIRWVDETGPSLLRTLQERDLMLYEGTLLQVIKELCQCHWTDNPREFATNGHNCEICGRQI